MNQSSEILKNGGHQVTVGCDLLAGSGKRGILTPDADGYYTVVLGAYGTQNSAGMFYDLPSGVAMFREDTVLMRRLKKGVLFMEFKHPEPFLPNGNPMSESQYLGRIRKIDDDRTCAHIKELTLVDGKDESGRSVKYVLGSVKPYGPYKTVYQDSLDNPNINTYNSVRSITNDDVMRGIKYTCEIVTWDFVGEGGILGANKYNSPALESFAGTSVVITPTTLWEIDDLYQKQKKMGLESASSLDVTDLMENLGWKRTKLKKKPAYLR